MTQSDFPWTQTLETTVFELAEWSFAEHGSRAALRDVSGSVSYEALGDLVSEAAASLARNGMGAGSRVAVAMANSRWLVAAYYALQSLGATVVPTDPGMVEEEVRRRCSRYGVDMLLSDIRDRSVEAVSFDEHVEQRVLREGSSEVRPADSWAPADALAHLVFTGGTSGMPKAVRVTNDNVVGNVRQMLIWRCGADIVRHADGLRVERLDSIASPLVQTSGGTTILVSPLYHAHALVNLTFFLVSGHTVVFLDRFKPNTMLDLIDEWDATYITGSPAMFNALCDVAEKGNWDLTSIRVLSSGAGPLSPSVHVRCVELFPRARVVQGYGLTECTCLVASPPLVEDVSAPIGSVGLPVVGTEIEVRTPAAELAASDSGEIWVRGPQVTAGYEAVEEAEALEQFRDGWVHTGDLGRFDDEGWLWITGRSKDIIIRKGYNVYPADLEARLQATGAVQQAAVIGVPHERDGEVPIGFVTRTHGCAMSLEDVKLQVNEDLLPYQRIDRLVEVAELPLSPAGKIRKSELRELWAADSTDT
ncbi:class I adenylate-forming enzyme family protein [Aeromicrobium sp. PE09-221]|uniref:class I adenylate-forming enzyme family protein n=1 Tax=Aeromicrobium sp. PE09-221 TaxID=1898043 RepID=UPI0011226305|nr:class I adenylate-forming enzyme family protein [Aeromicrobium sp. PE09-221]